MKHLPATIDNVAVDAVATFAMCDVICCLKIFFDASGPPPKHDRNKYLTAGHCGQLGGGLLVFFGSGA